MAEQKRTCKRVEIITIEVDGERVEAKECTTCGEVKKLTMYDKFKHGLGGRVAVCKVCRKNKREEKELRDGKCPKPTIVQVEKYGVMVEGKQCRECRVIKPLYEFYKGGVIGGRKSKCKDCVPYTKDAVELIPKLIDGVVVITKMCRKCNETKPLTLFAQCNQRGLGGRKSHCKSCRDDTVYIHRRLARKRQLPDTLTAEQTAEVLQHGCALTGAHDDVHLDHFIPLSWGHGGTIIENMIPLEGSLNMSKGDRNPFEWIKREDVQQRIDLRKWHNTVQYLAELNDMTPQQYEEYVYWCEENKRDLMSA